MDQLEQDETVSGRINKNFLICLINQPLPNDLLVKKHLEQDILVDIQCNTFSFPISEFGFKLQDYYPLP